MSIAVQMQWSLWSADISEAFLRGLSFEQLHLEEGEELRKVELALPTGSEHLIRTIEGYHDFDPTSEILILLKPGFGLRDAPRLWLLALKGVLASIGAVPTKIDPQLFFIHRGGKLRVVLSIHIDDIKLSGETEVMNEVISKLEAHFDTVKLEKDNFIHLGLQHERLSDGSIAESQSHYIQELKPIPDAHLRIMDKDAQVNDSDRHLFMSLLGGLAWTVQTRPDVAVFVGALQRKLQCPVVQDLLDLNRVLYYVKHKPLTMRFKKLRNPWKLIAISDSGFKGEGQDCLAIRSGLICLVNQDFPVQKANEVQIVEFVSKKQTRVCRSTYAAELHSGLDLMGLLFNVSMTMTELLLGEKTADELSSLHEAGNLPLKSELIIDAASVFESAIAPEPRAPNDQPLLIHLLKLRELMSAQQ